MTVENAKPAFENCPLHPDHLKQLRCRRFNILLCDHPECAKCVQPYSLCDYRDTCEIWNYDKRIKK
ncbi:MAG TPA: hypothetical protein PKW95_23510 [bacterium]|nr:hypothetical protein [bacterium]